MMKNIIKSIPNLLIVTLLAFVFFLGTASFNYFTQSADFVKWTSPDEAANYFFTKRFSLGENLAYFDEAAMLGDNMVMPRSFRADSGWLKPVSFLGIILIYGSLGKIFGLGIIPYLTPLVAALGIIVFYFLIKKLFTARIGLISSFLLASFPVYIYYSARSMFHNVLFIVLLITGAYLLLIACTKKLNVKNKDLTANKDSSIKNKELDSKEINQKKVLEKNEVSDKTLKISKRILIIEQAKNFFNKFSTFFQNKSFFSWKIKKTRLLSFLFAFLSGIFFGLMAITRTSELIWILPTAFIIWLFYLRRIGFIKLIILASGFILAILPNAYFNQLLYSAPIYGGYNEMNRSIDDLSEAGSGLVKKIITGEGDFLIYLKSIYHNVFYFGFKPLQSLEMANHYIIEMFPVLCGAFILGFLIILFLNFKKPQKKYFVYLLSLFILSLILIFYYGSWKFNDNPNPNRFTIGNSYTRYWLPIYLMMMPVASLAIIYLSKLLAFDFKKEASRLQKVIKNGWQAILTLAFVLIGLNFVLYGSEEGLSHLYYNNLTEKKYTQEVFSLTEADSIIITRYYDKFLFPDRRVIMGSLPNDEILTAAQKIVKYYPIYYYNFYLKDEDVNYLNDRKLPDYGLEIQFIKRISHTFGLYSLKQASSTVEIIN